MDLRKIKLQEEAIRHLRNQLHNAENELIVLENTKPCCCKCCKQELLSLTEYVTVSITPYTWATETEDILIRRYGRKNITKEKSFFDNGYHYAWKFYRKGACLKCMTPINHYELKDRL